VKRVLLVASIVLVGVVTLGTAAPSAQARPADDRSVLSFDPPVPANSGEGRRIVYSNRGQRVWVISRDGEVLRSFLVSGQPGQPKPGTYKVFSQSPRSYSFNDPNTTFRFMTRFAKGKNGENIGFHEIPRKNGKALQTVEQLGTPLGAGCLRSATADAKFIYDWAKPGTVVVVLP
jgi:lipoprotein-anchoring transpeptidase ErfK/SrfK